MPPLSSEGGVGGAPPSPHAQQVREAHRRSLENKRRKVEEKQAICRQLADEKISLAAQMQQQVENAIAGMNGARRACLEAGIPELAASVNPSESPALMPLRWVPAPTMPPTTAPTPFLATATGYGSGALVPTPGSSEAGAWESPSRPVKVEAPAGTPILSAPRQARSRKTRTSVGAAYRSVSGGQAAAAQAATYLQPHVVATPAGAGSRRGAGASTMVGGVEVGASPAQVALGPTTPGRAGALPGKEPVSATLPPSLRAPPSVTPLPHVAVLGTGRMAKALGRAWLTAGYHVSFGSRRPSELAEEMQSWRGSQVRVSGYAEAIHAANVVVLAVPFSYVQGIVKTYRAELKSRLVVDLSNPHHHQPADGRAGAEITEQNIGDGARVVAAFKSVFAETVQTITQAAAAWAARGESLASATQPVTVTATVAPGAGGPAGLGAKSLGDAGTAGEEVPPGESRPRVRVPGTLDARPPPPLAPPSDAGVQQGGTTGFAAVRDVYGELGAAQRDTMATGSPTSGLLADVPEGDEVWVGGGMGGGVGGMLGGSPRDGRSPSPDNVALLDSFLHTSAGDMSPPRVPPPPHAEGAMGHDTPLLASGTRPGGGQGGATPATPAPTSRSLTQPSPAEPAGTLPAPGTHAEGRSLHEREWQGALQGFGGLAMPQGGAVLAAPAQPMEAHPPGVPGAGGGSTQPSQFMTGLAAPSRYLAGPAAAPTLLGPQAGAGSGAAQAGIPVASVKDGAGGGGGPDGMDGARQAGGRGKAPAGGMEGGDAFAAGGAMAGASRAQPQGHGLFATSALAPRGGDGSAGAEEPTTATPRGGGGVPGITAVVGASPGGARGSTHGGGSLGPLGATPGAVSTVMTPLGPRAPGAAGGATSGYGTAIQVFVAGNSKADKDLVIKMIGDIPCFCGIDIGNLHSAVFLDHMGGLLVEMDRRLNHSHRNSIWQLSTLPALLPATAMPTRPAHGHGQSGPSSLSG
eukprot:jgi/Mesvir1/17901/Mv12969-RA.1